jgi:chitinase
MPASEFDFSALTHVVHFAVRPNTNGTLNRTADSLSESNVVDLVSHAHRAGRKVLVCVGGTGSATGFRGATTPGNLSQFVAGLTNFLATAGYDGVDLDWEPLLATDAPAFTNLVVGLRTALDGFPQRKLLTAAVSAYPPYGDPVSSHAALFASLQDKFDQINVMTYDLSGPYDGWVTWYNSPLFDGGFFFPETSRVVPSVNGSLTNFLQNGVKAGKLGIGIPFYGYAWTGGAGASTGGVALPRQAWKSAPTVTMPSFSAIMADYYQPRYYAWDPVAQAAYLSISNSDSQGKMFVTFDDARSCQAKIAYARSLGLGGVMIWELALDHQPGRPDPLLQAIKDALAVPTGTSSLNQHESHFGLPGSAETTDGQGDPATTNQMGGGLAPTNNAVPPARTGS